MTTVITTGEDIKTLTTALLDGDVMDDTTFYTLANMAKTIIEAHRPWRFLLAKDSSQTATPSDAYATTKSLPTGWLGYELYSPMVLEATDGSGDIIIPKGSKFADREANQDKGPLFYLDVANEAFGLILNISKNYTIYQNYYKESTEIDAANKWDAPARFNPLIAYFVSGLQKGGIDYDTIFARMATENRAQAKILMTAMENWDNAMQLMENNY